MNRIKGLYRSMCCEELGKKKRCWLREAISSEQEYNASDGALEGRAGDRAIHLIVDMVSVR